MSLNFRIQRSTFIRRVQENGSHGPTFSAVDVWGPNPDQTPPSVSRGTQSSSPLLLPQTTMAIDDNKEAPPGVLRCPSSQGSHATQQVVSSSQLAQSHGGRRRRVRGYLETSTKPLLRDWAERRSNGKTKNTVPARPPQAAGNSKPPLILLETRYIGIRLNVLSFLRHFLFITVSNTFGDALFTCTF